MDITEYISDRVDSEIRWYSDKAKHCQKMYKRLQVVEIILASSIPLLAPYADKYTGVSFIIGLSGAIIAITGSISKLYKYHDNWIQYRTTCELLKSQKNLFLTSSYPYNEGTESKESIFVKNIEAIMSAENAQWHSLNGTDDVSDSAHSATGS